MGNEEGKKDRNRERERERERDRDRALLVCDLAVRGVDRGCVWTWIQVWHTHTHTHTPRRRGVDYEYASIIHTHPHTHTQTHTHTHTHTQTLSSVLLLLQTLQGVRHWSLKLWSHSLNHSQPFNEEQLRTAIQEQWGVIRSSSEDSHTGAVRSNEEQFRGLYKQEQWGTVRSNEE